MSRSCPGLWRRPRHVVPAEPGAGAGARLTKPQQPEPYPADRAFHAMLAQPDRRHIAGRPVACLYRLGLASGGGAAAANGDRPGRAAQHAAGSLNPRSHCFSPGQGPWSLIKPQPQDRRFAKPEWETPAVQSARPGLSAERAVVAQGDHGRARRGAAERGDRRVLGAAVARYVGAVQFCRHQSRGAAEGVPERRREFRVRLAELAATT